MVAKNLENLEILKIAALRAHMVVKYLENPEILSIAAFGAPWLPTILKS